METKFSWDKTPINREAKIDSGDWLDLTIMLLGDKTQSGMVNICCAKSFFVAVSGLTRDRLIETLRPHLRDGKFEFRKGREPFKAICIQTTELFKGKQTLCYTFFLGG